MKFFQQYRDFPECKANAKIEANSKIKANTKIEANSKIEANAKFIGCLNVRKYHKDKTTAHGSWHKW